MGLSSLRPERVLTWLVIGWLNIMEGTDQSHLRSLITIRTILGTRRNADTTAITSSVRTITTTDTIIIDLMDTNRISTGIIITCPTISTRCSHRDRIIIRLVDSILPVTKVTGRTNNKITNSKTGWVFEKIFRVFFVALLYLKVFNVIVFLFVISEPGKAGSQKLKVFHL